MKLFDAQSRLAVAIKALEALKDNPVAKQALISLAIQANEIKKVVDVCTNKTIINKNAPL